MKLGLLTAIWGRPSVTQLFLDYYQDMPIDNLLCVSTTGGDGECTLNYGRFDVHYWPNEPLSEKWNYGMNKMRDCDAVIIVGSDDLITPKYIHALRYLLDSGAEYIYLEGAYFIDVTGPRMCYAAASRLGLGRCVSASLMDRIGWQPWPDDLQNGLDSHFVGRLSALDQPPREVRILDPVAHGYAGLDIKSGENIWSYDQVRDSLVVTDVSPQEVLEEHFPTVSQNLLGWHEHNNAEPERIDG